MASPGDLIAAIALALNMPEATVFQFDRKLSEAGLRKKSGRGKSAARVTATDAVNLLLAIVGTPVAGPAIRDAAIVSQTYARLVSWFPENLSKDFTKFGLYSLANLPKDHTLGDALTELIEAVALGETLLGFRRLPLDLPVMEDEEAILSIDFRAPVAAAQIMAVALSKNPELPSSYPQLRYQRAEPWSLRALSGDLLQERRITFRTIDALASVIRS